MILQRNSHRYPTYRYSTTGFDDERFFNEHFLLCIHEECAMLYQFIRSRSEVSYPETLT